MEITTKTEEKAQGADTQEVTRKAGKASTIKSFKTLVKNIEESGLMSKADHEKLKETYRKVVKQYMGEELL